MNPFWMVVSFVYGLVIGSFLNVCIYRIPKGVSLLYPPSSCPICGAKVRPADNFPLLSFIRLRGRCRSCGAKISWRYPLVELLTGCAFLAIYVKFGLTWQALAGLLLACVLIVVSFIDFDTKKIPNVIIFPAIGVGAVLAFASLAGFQAVPLLAKGAAQPAIGFLAGGGSLLGVALLAPLFFKKDALGGGDIKFAAFIGFFLGGYVLMALFFSFVFGAVAGMILIARGALSRGDAIPFGPYIAAGAFLTLFMGPQLWRLYLSASGLS